MIDTAWLLGIRVFVDAGIVERLIASEPIKRRRGEIDSMTPRIAVYLAVSLWCVGWSSRPRTPIGAWPDEPAELLDLNKTADQRHLNRDARVAEELAIRHADVSRGHRSGHYEGAHLRDQRMVDERFARLAESTDDVDDAGRDAGQLREPRELDGRRRRDLRWLEDNRVAGRERRRPAT
jgi:hypothetical protein